MFSVDIRNIFTFPDISPALGRVNVANFSKDKCPGVHFHFLLKKNYFINNNSPLNLRIMLGRKDATN